MIHAVGQTVAALKWRKVVAWLPMHACYIFGDLVCRVLNRIPDWEAKPVDLLAGAMYRVYNRCMLWSCDLNDWAGFSLWTHAPSDADSN